MYSASERKEELHYGKAIETKVLHEACVEAYSRWIDALLLARYLDDALLDFPLHWKVITHGCTRVPASCHPRRGRVRRGQPSCKYATAEPVKTKARAGDTDPHRRVDSADRR